MADARSVAAVAALAEPTRRRVYDHVVRQEWPVSRDDAAAALALPRATAAFHLDRLVADGLLDACFERRTGRTGPGAGRPAKVYQRGASAVTVSLPERRYDLAGELLADALAEAAGSGAPPVQVLDRGARQRGRELGSQAGAGRGAALRLLEEYGYEPRPDGDAIGLANCPFHALAGRQPDLVCGMNLRLLEGVLDGVGERGLTARLCPPDGGCCVRMEPTERDAGAAG
jgi:predicted ArsR family transcriptional regulator